jgi:hypothetical protein
VAFGATIGPMRDLDRQYRITARSIPEIIGPMERALSHFGESRSVLFRGRKLSNEAFINAAILGLIEMEPDQLEAVIAALIGRLEGILAESDEERARAAKVAGTSRATPVIAKAFAKLLASEPPLAAAQSVRVDPKSGKPIPDEPAPKAPRRKRSV